MRGGSYIDSPDWRKKKKATIKPKNTDEICFQYATTVAINYEETESHPDRISSIKQFINRRDKLSIKRKKTSIKKR